MDFKPKAHPPGKKLSFADVDPNDTGPFTGKDDPRAVELAKDAEEKLTDLQEKLYAEGRRAVLVVLQAMDTAGKDGVLRRVVGPLDSRGVHVWSFKAPTEDELAHDFLWRVHMKTPRKGEMCFFNRSHYEDVLVARVLDLVPKSVWSGRYESINCFEKILSDSNTRVVKFFLHISKDEQKKRLQERLDTPSKRWKFDPSDLKMRGYWEDFQRAYEDAIARCSTEEAPWYIVPANHKWYRDLVVSRVIVDVLEGMRLKQREADFDYKKVVIPD